MGGLMTNVMAGGFDITLLVLVVPAMLLGLWAQSKVQSTFRTFSQYRTSRGYTGRDVARQILNDNGLQDIPIEHIQGNLTDHYDPRGRVVRLSDSVYDSPSIAAVGVAAHEVGHAIQHATGYAPMKLRSAIIPITNIGSTAAIPLIVVGFAIGFAGLINIGIILYATVAVFQLVTLPVEFNASNRALATLEGRGMLESEEMAGAKKVLSAAAMTYVAALVSTLATLLRFVLLSRRRR